MAGPSAPASGESRAAYLHGLKQRVVDYLTSLPFYPKSRKIMLDGQILEEIDIPRTADGSFIRLDSKLARDKEVDPSTVEPGRYNLFVCHGCPWAHRASIVRGLMGFGEAMPMIATEGWFPWTAGMPALATGGWRIDAEQLEPVKSAMRNAPKAHQNAAAVKGEAFYLWRLYASTESTYTGRVTIPIIWDSENARIVNNESAEVIRLLNTQFGPIAAPGSPDLYPEALRAEVDAVNMRLQDGFNNCVYRVGFATTDAAYHMAKENLFNTMDWMEELLADRLYLNGDNMTESDVRAFTTLVRFDSAYHMMFRCTDKRLRTGYPNLFAYLRRMYVNPVFRESCRGMLLGYPIMYSIICKWEGRRIANTMRLMEVLCFFLLSALAPDAPTWRYRLAATLCLPLRLLARIDDPLPSPLW